MYRTIYPAMHNEILHSVAYQTDSSRVRDSGSLIIKHPKNDTAYHYCFLKTSRLGDDGILTTLCCDDVPMMLR